mgnify:CR=1 FL=1
MHTFFFNWLPSLRMRFFVFIRLNNHTQKTTKPIKDAKNKSVKWDFKGSVLGWGVWERLREKLTHKRGCLHVDFLSHSNNIWHNKGIGWPFFGLERILFFKRKEGTNKLTTTSQPPTNKQPRIVASVGVQKHHGLASSQCWLPAAASFAVFCFV